MKLEDYSSFICDLEDGLARVTFNAPERGNVVDETFCREIKELAVELSESNKVRAILLAAKGRFFSVGGDIRSFVQDRSALPILVKKWTADLHSAIARFMRMRAPIVAAVQGDVAGGGVSLMASADVIYAAETAKFTAGFPMIGFSADSGSTATLSQRMGSSRAKRFLLMAETLDAQAALDAGLVDFVTSRRFGGRGGGDRQKIGRRPNARLWRHKANNDESKEPGLRGANGRRGSDARADRSLRRRLGGHQCFPGKARS
jgi:2-(1,2-epoxy-1,2-dihydrophenyl)acetyl-CoA isomerase